MSKLAGVSEGSWQAVELRETASIEATAALGLLGSSEAGLSAAEASVRLRVGGPNAVLSHGARPLRVLVRQLKNPLLVLLVAAALVSILVGQGVDAAIILVIVCLSVGLGFINEYRSEKAVEELHSTIRHSAVTTRDGRVAAVDVTELVPGDVVDLDVGEVVPADIRLLQANALECDESVLTGESLPAPKTTGPSPISDSSLDLPSCALMGTVVRAGTGRGVVVATGPRTAFGRIAQGLGERPPETAFQLGLRDFSKLLIRVTVALTASIFVINALLRRPLLEAALFALAIAVGLTPQLLPAIVTISLSTGARRLAKKEVVVKRLVSIEDLGNIEILFTDKTGTLTEGRIVLSGSVDPTGSPSDEVFMLGLLCNSAEVQDGVAVGGNPLDRALWESEDARNARVSEYRRVAEAPFDYDRRLMSVLVDGPDGRRRVVSKGAPESVLDRCADVGAGVRETLDGLFGAGARVVGVATKEAAGLTAIGPADEQQLQLSGFLVFADPPKADAAASLDRLRALGIEVKVVTGDNALVARKVCTDLPMDVHGILTGGDIERLGDQELAAALPGTTIFARVTPEQKSRIIRVQRGLGTDVAFLGDGVNDAVALHDADVGISVDSAADVAKDAADIVMLEKDLGVLAEGVVEGRRIFSNTIKYVLMGTSSNFGNMFSAAGASIFLKFLPMLPTQILLNNLLYDVSEMTIPTDNVDEEMLQRPSYWDTRFIRRFMAFFGPISSIYDFLTFGVMLFVFRAGESLFQTGWFVESLASQSLVIFVIRTRRIPFYRSRASAPLFATTLACSLLGAALPFTPLAHLFGFSPLPAAFMGILAVMIATYLLLVDLGKRLFFRAERRGEPLAVHRPPRERRIHRLATRWTHPAPTGAKTRGSFAPS
ncbi:MAG TPA: magnesium-translocating P-type ATPase [Actinomycetota bacterium]